jgi:hypothetical protein
MIPTKLWVEAHAFFEDLLRRLRTKPLVYHEV